jgi:hypothetical protein
VIGAPNAKFLIVIVVVDDVAGVDDVDEGDAAVPDEADDHALELHAAAEATRSATATRRRD